MSVVLVTGGAGFIGGRLVEALLARSWEVIVLDDFSASDPSSLDGRAGKLTVYGGSVTDAKLLAVIMRRGVTHVVHLATRNITVSETDPARSFAVNAGGMVAVLREAAKHQVQRVVFTSTASVYGDDRMPAFERYEPKPRTVYSIAKYAAELCGATFPSVPLDILRLSNVYGPGQNDSTNPYCGVVGHLMRAAAAGTPATVYGDGTATRDYTYIDDVVGALAIAMARGTGGVFNVSTGQETSTRDLVGMVARVTGRPLEINHRTARSIDVVARRVVDSSKFRDTFSWRPSVDLEQGLVRTWEWWNK